MRKVIIIVMLCAVAVAAGYAEELPGGRYAINDEAYEEWNSMTDVEKTSYVWGVLTGAYALASDLDWGTDSSHATDYIEQVLPPSFSVGTYIGMIDYIYEAPTMRDAPIWTLLFRMRRAVEARKAYEQ